MPLAPGTPYRNPHASQNSSDWESKLASMRSSHPSPEEPQPISPSAAPSEEMPLGDLFHRRQSRRLELAALRLAEPEATFDHNRGSRVGSDMDRGVWEGDEDLRRPEEAHFSFYQRPEVQMESDEGVERDLERQGGDDDVEADVWLTRKEKKEWATVFLIGGLGFCAFVGLIAGLAVS